MDTKYYNHRSKRHMVSSVVPIGKYTCNRHIHKYTRCYSASVSVFVCGLETFTATYRICNTVLEESAFYYSFGGGYLQLKLVSLSLLFSSLFISKWKLETEYDFVK